MNVFTITEVHLRDAYQGTRSHDEREVSKPRCNQTTSTAASNSGLKSADTSLPTSTFFLWRQSFEACSGRFYYHRWRLQETLSTPPCTGFVPLIRRPADSLKAQNSMPHSVPHEKYWSQRRRLFSLFDHGVQLDSESWFSVTPECVAHHQAWRCVKTLRDEEPLRNTNGHQPLVIFDAFSGVGGNTIAFARHLNVHVFACDTNEKRISMASHNTRTVSYTHLTLPTKA